MRVSRKETRDKIDRCREYYKEMKTNSNPIPNLKLLQMDEIKQLLNKYVEAKS